MAETTSTTNTVNTPPTPPSAVRQSPPASKPGEGRGQSRPTFWLTGQIVSSQLVRKKDGEPYECRDGHSLYETVLMTPAADEYSYPNQYPIMSRSSLGRKRDELTIEVELRCKQRREQGYLFRDLSLWAVPAP